MLGGIEERKKEQRGRKKNKNKIELFAFDFLIYEEKSWESGAVFYIRTGKGFHL